MTVKSLPTIVPGVRIADTFGTDFEFGPHRPMRLFTVESIIGVTPESVQIMSTNGQVHVLMTLFPEDYMVC